MATHLRSVTYHYKQLQVFIMMKLYEERHHTIVDINISLQLSVLIIASTVGDFTFLLKL